MNYLFICLNLSTVWDVFCLVMHCFYLMHKRWRSLEFGKIKWSWIWLAMLHTQAAHDGHHISGHLWKLLSYESHCVCVLQACLVHTIETIRVRYFMDRLLERRRPVMLVGNAGTGKSVLVGDKLGSLDPEKYAIKNVPFNYYTTSEMLQGVCVFRNTMSLLSSIRPWTQKCNFKPFWQW